MTREQHLLTILIEECAEVSQRATKALRFGTAEIQEGHLNTNSERLREEITDLIAVLSMLEIEGIISDERYELNPKRQKVEKYLAYSKHCGTLD